MSKNQISKIVLTSPIGEVLTVKVFDDVKINFNSTTKVPSFSMKIRVFDETEIKKYSIGTEVKIYSTTEGNKLDDHLIFKGIVQSKPKSLDSIEKTYIFGGLGKVSLSQSILVNEAYVDTKIDTIINDLLTKYASGVFTIGYIQPVTYTITIKFKDTYLYSALERLSEAIGFTFELDLNDNFNFYEKTSKTSNIPIKMGDYWKGTANFEEDSSKLTNYLTVYGGKSLSNDVKQVIKGDGSNYTYPLNYKPRSSSSGSIQVTLNGVSLSVGISGLHNDSSGKDCLINYNEKNITYLNSDGTVKILTTSDTSEVTYRYESKLITRIEDKGSIEKYGKKDSFEKFLDITDKVALQERAKAHLRKYSEPIITGSLSTWKNDHEAGENTKVEIETDEGFFINEWLQISEKKIEIKPNEIKTSYKFEKGNGLDGTLKTILERLNELEKNDENEIVQQLDVVNDNFSVQSLFKVTTSKGRGFLMGSKIGGKL